MRIRFGLGAWSNPHFEHTLYPLRTPHSEYLPRYSAVFPCVEVDKLYHFPTDAQQLYGWVEGVDGDFQFLPKLHKTVCAEDKDDASLQRAKAVMDTYAPLGKHLGPVLAQFPASWGYTEEDLDWLDQLLALRPGAMAVELRNDSWWRDDVEATLARHNAALVWGTHHKAPAPAWTTADFGYVRFVGPHFKDNRGRHTSQEERVMDVLAMRERMQAAPWNECYAIVTNTFEGNAVDSLPMICAALGDEVLAKRCTRKPGQALLPKPAAQGQSRLF